MVVVGFLEFRARIFLGKGNRVACPGVRIGFIVQSGWRRCEEKEERRDRDREVYEGDVEEGDG